MLHFYTLEHSKILLDIDDYKTMSEYKLNEKEWRKLEEIREILRPFLELT